jgi:hypothetical protein
VTTATATGPSIKRSAAAKAKPNTTSPTKTTRTARRERPLRATRTITASIEPQEAPEPLLASPMTPPTEGWWFGSDDRWHPPIEEPTPRQRAAKADAKAARGRAVAAAKARASDVPPWHQKKRFVLPIVLTALIVGAALISGGGNDRATASSKRASAATTAAQRDVLLNVGHPPAGDVVTTECATDDFGYPVARGTIVNHTSKQADYSISEAFADPTGAKFADGFDVVQRVEPGQQVAWEAVAVKSAFAGSTTSCELAKVERFASSARPVSG